MPTEQLQQRIALLPVPGTDSTLESTGARVRVAVDTPGDTRARWQFALKEFPGEVLYDVAHSSARPSSLALPVLKGVTSTTPLPACPSLRGQQCRDHVPFTNMPAAP